MRVRPDGDTERGIVLIAMLFVLLGSSSLWLAQAAGSHAPGAATKTTFAGIERRRRAREALLAHAALYAWSYGPTGAGPGHLPCPDTDVLLLPMGDRHRAGPDPPCAARPAALGALPLYVTVGTQRSALDPHGVFAEALGYRVAAEVVNNPQGRPVDGTLVLGEVLSIGDRSIVAEGGTSALAVNSTALLDPVERGVGAWAIEQLDALPATTVRTLCGSATPCRLLEALAPGDALFEAVTQARHWFVRNDWNDDIELQVDAVCRDGTARCRWVIDDHARRHARRAATTSLPALRLWHVPREPR